MPSSQRLVILLDRFARSPKTINQSKEGKVVSGSISFSYTGKIVTFTAPTTGTYDIEAIGGSGGNGLLVWAETAP